MPQEFQVLRCFSCQTFQVHQVKKAKKWNCKVCGEKQSILKVFGRGTGVECRGHTQKLNRLQGETKDYLDLKHSPHKEPRTFENDQQSAYTPDLPAVGNTSGRWSHYMEETNGEADDKNLREVTPDYSAFTTDWNQYKTYSKQAKLTRIAGKRKAYGKLECEQADLSESHTAGSNCHSSFGRHFNKKSRVSSHTNDENDQLTAEAKNRVNIALGGCSKMDFTGEPNKTFGNEHRFKTSSAVNFKRDQSETYSTNPGQGSVYVPLARKLSSESHSFTEFHDSGHNKEMKISHSEHAIKSTVKASNLYQHFTKEPSHIIQSDSFDFYGKETANKFGVRSGIQNKLTITNNTGNNLNTSPACALKEVNPMSNCKTEIFSKTIKMQNVNCELQSTAFVPKKKTNQRNSNAKRTVSNSKWGKFLTIPQESSDECSQELEFDQQGDKHCSKTAISNSHNSAEPLSISDSDKTCLENTMWADSCNSVDAPLSSTCSKVATTYDEFSRKSDIEPNVQNLFSLDDSDGDNALTFEL